MSCTASGSSAPACATSIGSSFTSAQSRDVLRRRDLGVRGELAVGDDLALALRRRQVLDERRRVGGVLGALHEPDAGEVRVRAGAVLVGPGGRDGEVGVVREDPREVVVVGEPDVAAARGDRLEHVDVGAEDLRLVGHPRLEQRPRLLGPALGEHVGDERLVVLVVGRPQAELAPPLRVAEVLVAASRRPPARRWSASACGCGPRDPTSRRRGRGTPPGPGPRACRCGHGCEQPGLLRAPQVREVRGDEQVGGRAVALAMRSRSNSSGAVPPRSSSDLPVSSSHCVNTVSSPYCDRPL